MNGPSDEIGPIWQGVVPQSPGDIADIVAGLRRAEPVEDTPIEGQMHLSTHAVPIGATEGEMIYRGLDFEGMPVWEPVTEEEEFVLEARESLPRSSLKTRRPLREMFEADERKRREAEEEARKRRSTDPLDRLEVYMTDRIWREDVYDEPLDAQEALDDVLDWLRAHTKADTVASVDDVAVRVDRRFI